MIRAVSMIATAFALCLATPPACRSSDGEWVVEHDERAHYRGRRVDGKKHGVWIRSLDPTFSSGTYTLTEWRHGVEHGITKYFIDGEVVQDMRYRHGVHDGRWRGFNGPGRLDMLRWAVNGEWHWWSCEWHLYTGKLEYVEYYRHGARQLLESDPDPPICPPLLGDGARHLDPNDRDYDLPPDRPRGPLRRPIPMP